MTIGTRARIVAGAAAVALLTAGFATTKTSSAAQSKAMSPHAALFSSSQAELGSKAYETNCSGCHGANLEGGAGPALSGGTLNTLAKNTKLTVGDLYTFVSQQMPLNAPASLSKPQYSAIIAYILKYNGFPAGSKPLTPAAALASKVVVHSNKP